MKSSVCGGRKYNPLNRLVNSVHPVEKPQDGIEAIDGKANPHPENRPMIKPRPSPQANANEAGPFSIRLAASGDIPGMAGLLSELFAIEANFRPDPARRAIARSCNHLILKKIKFVQNLSISLKIIWLTFLHAIALIRPARKPACGCCCKAPQPEPG
jgi:hypothetical protein